MNVYLALILDAEYNGRLTGQHTRQAELDIEATGIFRTLLFLVREDTLPEETVAAYFSAIWTNPKLDGYRLEQPLAPSKPEPGLSIRERVRREAVRWFQAIGEGYTPIALSPDETAAAVRKEIRLAQLADAHPVFLAHFRKSLGLPETKEAPQP